MVDATTGFERLTFLDAYYGYNQIKMHKEYQEKTTCIAEKRLLCYKVMPFGLKNVGDTYHRLVNKMFKDLIGNTMEVYIDNMVIKTKMKQDHISEMQETFCIMRKYQMKLNPSKCAFGVSSR